MRLVLAKVKALPAWTGPDSPQSPVWTTNPFPFVCDCGQVFRTAREVVCCLLSHREGGFD